jgi:4-amino-4-deoxy-L-arabinose transferase-like glycosyltransferase
VVALTLVALAIRVVELSRLSFWYDESISLLMVSQRSFSAWLIDVHPPLHYALLLAAAQVSTSDVGLRLPSAVLGAITVPALYALGVRLFDRVVALWAAAFLTVTWLHVAYSREARMYSLLVFGFTLALWGIVAGARDGKVAGWIAYALGGALMTWTHGVGVYYAAIVALVALILRPAWRPWLVANLAIVVLFLPWVPFAIRNTRRTVESFWIEALSPEPPVFLTIYQFTVAPIPAGAGLWIAVLLTALGLAIALGHRQERRSVHFLVLAYLAPIGAFTALSLMVRPILAPRILLPVVVPLVLLFAVGVRAVPWRRGHVVAGMLVGVILMLATAYGLRRDSAHTEGWREVARYLQDNARSGDAVLVLSSPRLHDRPEEIARGDAEPGETLLLRYDDTRKLGNLPRLTLRRVMRTCRDEVGACLNAALRAASPAGDIWVVRRKVALPAPVVQWLDHALESDHSERFRAITVERSRLRG